MRVNLELLEQYGRVAVHCTSEKDAITFVEAMWEQHPEKMERAWKKGMTNWSSYAGADIYYVPRLFHDVDEDEYGHMQSSKLDWLLNHNYTVVEFPVLLQELDFGELPEPEFDMKSLFDMG